MTPDFRNRALEILLELDEIPTSERPDRLAELTAGNPELLAAVEEMEQVHEAAQKNSLLDGPVINQVENQDLPPEQVETVVPPPGSEEAAAAEIPPEAPAGMRFQPQRKLGEGGQGEVWLAIDPELDRQVAVKIIKKKLTGSQDILRKFQREAEVTGKLEHPGIVPIYEAGRQNSEESSSDSPFYVMRVYREQSLHEAIKDFHGNDWSEPRLRELLLRFIDVCNAVGYAHSRGVIHRDLKPQNVMLGEFGETLVVDWGMAKVVGRDEPYAENDGDGTVRMDRDPNATVAGSIMGTPAYMSPEQARGEVTTLGPSTDIFGLGAILYCVLTGKPPGKGQTTQEILDYIRACRFNSPRTVKANVPAALSAICLKALAKEPLDRYRKAESTDDSTEITLATDITRWLNDEPVSVYREPMLVRLRRWIRKHQTLAATTAVTVLMAIVALSVLIVVVNGKNEELASSNADLLDANARETASRKLAEENAKEAIRQENLAVAAEELAEERAEEATEAKLLAEKSAAEATQARAGAEASEETATEQRKIAEANASTAREQTQLALSTLNTVIFDIQRGLKNVPGAGQVRQQILNTALQQLGKIASDFADTDVADRQTSVALGEMADTILKFGLGDSELQIGRISSKSPVEFALALHRRALEIDLRLAEADPTDAQAQSDLAYSYTKLGEVSLQTGAVQEAVEFFRKSLEIDLRLAEADPTDAQAQRKLAVSFERLGTVEIQRGNIATAKEWFEKELAIAKQRIELDPANSEAQRFILVVYTKLGDVSLQTGAVQDAVEFFRKGLEIAERLAKADPTDAQAQRALSVTYNKLGNVSLQTGAVQEAVEFFRKDLEIAERLAKADPTDAQAQRDLSFSYNRLGDVSLQMGAVQEAVEFFRKGFEIAERRAKADPTDAQAQRDLSVSYNKLGDVSLQMGAVQEAVEFYRKDLEIAERLAKADPTDAQAQRDLMVSHYKLGGVQNTLFAYTEAAEHYRQGIAVLDRMIAAGQNVEKSTGEKEILQRLVAAADRAAIAAGDWLALQKQPEDQLPMLLSIRCTELAKQGRADDVAQAAANLRVLSVDATDGQDGMLYNAACGFGLCVQLVKPQEEGQELTAEQQKSRSEYVDLSLTCLKEAIAAGYDDFDQMQQDSDLSALHELPEFKALLPAKEKKEADPT